MPNNHLCLLVEDQEQVRFYLQDALQKAFPDLRIIAVDNVQKAKKWLSEDLPQISNSVLKMALIDLGLPDGSGIEVVRMIKSAQPETISVVITIYDDDHFLFNALSAGASGYILKEHEPNLLIEILRRIDKNEPPLSPSISRRLLQHFQETTSEENEEVALTKREKETLVLIARGLTVSETAAQMGLSPQTVSGYVKIIYQKLHISNRAEATRIALRRGLI